MSFGGKGKMKKFLLIISLLHTTLVWADPFKVSSQHGHEIKLLTHGLSSLQLRLDMIKRANKEIDVEYFIYIADKSGRIFTKALIEAAQRGVKVRMLLDYFMIKDQVTPFHIYELEKYGIEVKYFNPVSNLKMFSTQYRNHRKALIVDDIEFVTGGRNIADEYFDLNETYNFMDRDIWVKGPVVESVGKSFDVMWKSDLSYKIERPKRPELTDVRYRKYEYPQDEDQFQDDLNRWNKKVESTKNLLELRDEDKKVIDQLEGVTRPLLSEEYEGTCENIQFFSEYPVIKLKNREVRVLKHQMFSRIAGAKKEVVIDSPYFIVNKEASFALENALRRGVHVSLLTNGLNSTDAIYVYDVFETIVKTWIELGLQTYILRGEKPSFYQTLPNLVDKARWGTHSKTFIFDEDETWVGTFNLDPRSYNFNTEMSVGCIGNKELADTLKSDIDRRLDAAFYLETKSDVRKTKFYQVSFLKQMQYLLLKAPANLFDFLL